MKNYANSERCEVEKSYEAEIIRILKQHEFTEMKKMPYQSLFDFIAKKDDNDVFIEVKTRYGNDKFFTIRISKLMRLEELEGDSGKVFLLFINKLSHQLLTLKDFLKGENLDNEYIRVSVNDDVRDGRYKDCWFTKKNWVRVSAQRARRTNSITTTIRLPQETYDKIQEEIEDGESESVGQVIRKALRERFRPKEAW